MTSLRSLLRSWWKEERHLQPSAAVVRLALAVSLLLLSPLFLLHLRQRTDAGLAEEQQRLQESLGIVEAAYGSVQRAVLDWGHWDSLYGYVTGSNPGFPVTDIQTTALFDGGMVMLVLGNDGVPILHHAVRGYQPRGMERLVRCSRGLPKLPTIASSARLLCQDAAGVAYIAVATPISNNDSSAARRGTLVFFDPLLRPDYAANIRRSLGRFQANLEWRPASLQGSAATAPAPIRPLIHGDGGRLLAFRPTSVLPILGRVLLEDLLLALAFAFGVLGFRMTLLLERRRQRLLHRRRERLGDQRIRRVCRQLDALHSDLGLNSRAASRGSVTLARLLRLRQQHGPAGDSPLPPEDEAALPGDDRDGSSTAEPQALSAAAAADPDVDHRLQRLAGRFQDFLESAQTLALIDPLTQLPNRRFFLDQLATLARQNREAGSRYAVLFVDIDRFKSINDTFGHRFGDQVLTEVAKRLRLLMRPNDFLSRYGGDELAILMDLSTSGSGLEELQRSAAHGLARRITETLSQPILLDDLLIELSISVGIALIDPGITGTAQAMQQSDIAMYRAKRHKTSRIAIFDVDDRSTNLDSYQLYLDLMQAVRQQQLQVEFQPIVCSERQMVGVEALARWPHPRHGMVPPEQFLDLAEQHRQLGTLWHAILERSLLDFRALSQRISSLDLALNLAPSQLSETDLVSQLDRRLDSHGIDPARVTIEITERAVLEASALVRRNLADLRQRGIRIALDDFGTGFSSLTLLSELRPDEIKIDRSFVNVMENDPYAHHIVVLITGMARNLGITLVAEGVERISTLRALERLGVHRFQGYLFSRPRPWSDILTLPQPIQGGPPSTS